jgi:hypothetical protein
VLDLFRDDFEFLVRITGEFKWASLAPSELQGLLRYLSKNQRLLHSMNLMVHVKIFDALMNALSADASPESLTFALDFLLLFKDFNIYRRIDGHMKDLLFDRLLNPIVAIRNPPKPQINTLIALISTLPDAIEDAGHFRPLAAPTVEPRTVRAWIMTLSQTIDIDRAAPELLVAIGDIIQLAIINPELGYDPVTMRTCVTLWIQIKHRMDIPIKPRLLPVVLRRMRMGAPNQDPDRRGDTAELGAAYDTLGRSLMQNPRHVADLIAAIVKEE